VNVRWITWGTRILLWRESLILYRNMRRSLPLMLSVAVFLGVQLAFFARLSHSGKMTGPDAYALLRTLLGSYGLGTYTVFAAQAVGHVFLRDRLTKAMEPILATPVPVTAVWVGKSGATWLVGTLAYAATVVSYTFGVAIFDVFPELSPAETVLTVVTGAVASPLFFFCLTLLYALGQLVGGKRLQRGALSALTLVFGGVAFAAGYFQIKSGVGIAILLAGSLALSVVTAGASALLARRWLTCESLLLRMYA
jgi:hypothetical protein